MSSVTNRPFIDACLAGEALDLDVDDWVERWHAAGGAPDGQAVRLSAYLGMTDHEYGLWVEEPESLRTVIASHRFGVELTELLKSSTDMALAARASAGRESVSLVVQRLVELGDLAAHEVELPDS